MNPKIKIVVDDKNKAIAYMTGLATVGAKVDVEIKGIPESYVPSWGPDDPFTGKSLRFRIVDMVGHDLVRFPLVERDPSATPPIAGDKWKVSTEDGETVFSTYDPDATVSPVADFNTAQLRRWFRGVPFNEKMELGLVLDSVVDSAEYAVGKISVRQWAHASCEDPTVVPNVWDMMGKLARKPLTGRIEDDSSLNDVIWKLNTLIKELKGE